jgi:hypothetical protein
MTAMEARQELALVVLRVSTGGLGYDDGFVQAAPLLDVINNRGVEIAKKHGRRYAPLTFGKALRLGVD